MPVPSAPHSHFWPAAAYAPQPSAATSSGTAPAPWAPSRITGTPTSASSAGRDLARHPAHVRAGDERGRRAHGLGQRGERHQAHVRPAVARRLQRPDQAGVLLVGGHDLVARAEVHPGHDGADPLAGGGGQRDVGDVAAQHPRVAGAQRVLQLEAPQEVRRGPALVELGLELLARRSHGGGGQRPVRARVEVGDRLEDGELGAQGGGVHRRGTVTPCATVGASTSVVRWADF